MHWQIVLGPRSYPLHDAPDYFSDCSSDFIDDTLEDRASSGLFAGAGGAWRQSPSAAASPSLTEDSVSTSSSESRLAFMPSAEPLKHNIISRLKDRQTAAVTVEAVYDLPPDTLFDLLADPRQHTRVFNAIERADSELLEDDGARRKWRLDYHARWSFWKVSGVCHNRLFMWTDRDAGTVTFKLREPGFLKTYEGTWTIKPACGTPMASLYAHAGQRAGHGLAGWSAAAVPVASVTMTAPASTSSFVTQAVTAIAQAHQRFMHPMVAMPALPWTQQLPAGSLLFGGKEDKEDKDSVATASSGPISSRITAVRQLQTHIVIETTSSPKISPPYPINQVLKSQVSGQVSDMLDGLVAAAVLKLQASPLVV